MDLNGLVQGTEWEPAAVDSNVIGMGLARFVLQEVMLGGVEVREPGERDEQHCWPTYAQSISRAP